MKHLKLLLVAFALTFSAALISCEEEEETTVQDDCYMYLSELSQVLSTKSTAFSNNPNSTTCGAVRTAAINLLHAAEDCDAAGQYEQATQTWMDLDCSDFD